MPAIVGASSAVRFAAEQLARAGWRVAIFERQPHLAPARRTLIMTPPVAPCAWVCARPSAIPHHADDG
ncbi:MAG: hypothetical protein HC837_20255, partial [Chloroflexaceae bacterium]|nr:hypothetical protein [Chloroflexaceae bacterium]